ncbi:MAG: 4-alpha-glucanotransferase [Akkermansiaceae bacterium]|nr:4-alpha-glucanotransferase [Akkermansiaceae bacterium]
MKVIFRINYRTVPGQSVWIRYSTQVGGVDRYLELHWLNESQWEGAIEVDETGRLLIEYLYQMRQKSNGVALDEWHGPRVVDIDLTKNQVVMLIDTWCSAGTVDYSFETQAFFATHSPHGGFQNVDRPPRANHTFRLRMAAVPVGLAPCLLGSVRELGQWDRDAAVPLVEVAPNLWEASLDLPNGREIEYKYGLSEPGSSRVISLEEYSNRILIAHVFGEFQWTQVNDEAYARDPATLFRGAGVAIPVFSLRSDEGLGVGEFADLKGLADWAKTVGLKLIQILPINDTTSSWDWTDSYPYSAISVFALHPIYLRIDQLSVVVPQDVLQQIDEIRAGLNLLEKVDYEQVMRLKARLTREIYRVNSAEIRGRSEFCDFLADNFDWVVPYAAFCVLRDVYGTADFGQWDRWAVYERGRVEAMLGEGHERSNEIFYHLWLQFELDRQLDDAVEYLHACGLALKGDLPIGIDRQSVEAWSAPHLFKMDAQAGAPPDAFAVKGQNWGFPTYDWEIMRRDGYAWWRARFARLSRYFDAYRIDHILGFFRIWQVPSEQVEGIMGYFDPALPISIVEIRERGIPFELERYCKPYVRDACLLERFGDRASELKERFFREVSDGVYELLDAFSTQRRVVDCFRDRPDEIEIQQGLLDCVSEVLFLEVEGSDGAFFHPRCLMQMTRSFQALDVEVRQRVEDLYNDYFYRRQEDFWQARGYEKLPLMRRASPMLLCGEDLGMVPACVPGVLKELGILSLEIQRMPKSSQTEFVDLRNVPYMSVVSPSTHDMPTLRAWWREDPAVVARFVRESFGSMSAETELSGEIASEILKQHLGSPAMWVVFPLQDLLAIDEGLRHPDPEAERINVPAIMPFYWRYRVHLGLGELQGAEEFNRRVGRLIVDAGR